MKVRVEKVSPEAGIFCENALEPCQKTWATRGSYTLDSRPSPELGFPQSWPLTKVWEGVGSGGVGANIYSCSFAEDGTARYPLDARTVPLSPTLYANQGCNSYSYKPWPFTNRVTTENRQIVAPAEYPGALLCLRQY
ncbi:hypothetical protein C8_206 [Cannes 8 virus]|uniref:Uncharacterized protein n=1 Tax=Marseillevirus marseillevirus TaxID=694581 RepID=D2XAK0_GBMV|nr:hypothetical protein MAR_ORF198 [Marseillevirus marseillevirus]YP_009094678.1 hypothetical protein MEL_177 [Melbournevirus]AGV01555.1 hypothetical protein C8_206 [Cannes 8 virus]AVR52913.1 hypothetical protein MarSH_208 [Marseillevirus Shanghai 1]ADB03977.1 hypothetical protein MAR_ORF198 [Marseillevirus marseillevirus]AIT54790.1 hypothetical protein MEL_177 [Melbournevirus]